MSDSDQVVDLLRYGIAAAKAGRKGEARHALIKVTELDERNESAWLWLSGVVDTVEDRHVCLENVLAVNPDNRQAQAGIQWLEEHHPTLTKKSNSLSTSRCPQCTTFVPYNSTTCERCGQRLVIICPHCERYIDIDSAVCPHCQRALGDFRDGAAFYLSLAKAYLEREQYGLVQEAIEQAEALAPEDPRVLGAVANFEDQIGAIDRAVETYQRAIARDPDNAMLYIALGSIHRRRGMDEEARTLYEQAVDRAADNPLALLRLAQVYVATDEHSRQTLRLLERAIDVDPAYAEAHLLLCDVYLERGHWKKAVRHCQQARDLTEETSSLGREARMKLAQIVAGRNEKTWQAVIDGQMPQVIGYKRPGCVTLYAILLIVTGAILLLGSGWAVFELFNRAPGVGVVDVLLPIAFLVGAGAYGGLSIGLWKQREWARQLLIGMLALNMIGSVTAYVLAFLYWSVVTGIGGALALTGGMLFILSIAGYIIYWFSVNSKYFE